MIKPDLIIGENYLSRWYVIPRNKFFNIYLHKFTGSDDDRALHDHPWWSFSILLAGNLTEHCRMEITQNGKTRYSTNYGTPVRRRVGLFRLRSAILAHRLELNSKTAWTLFFTGPKIREWGFWCTTGFKHWSLMSDADGKKIGGCE